MTRTNREEYTIFFSIWSSGGCLKMRWYGQLGVAPTLGFFRDGRPVVGAPKCVGTVSSGSPQPYVFFRWGASSPSKFLVIYKCKTVAYMMKKSSQPLLFCIIFEHSEFTIYSISSVEIGAGRGRSAGGGCPKMRWYGQLGVAPKDCQNSGLSGFRNSAPGRACLLYTSPSPRDS